MHLCIVGSGYVGLVSAACFAEMGNQVYCVDVSTEVVSKLRNGEIHIFEPGLHELVVRNHSEGRLFFTTKIEEALKEVDVVFIAVGTPTKTDGSCDLSFIESVAMDIGTYMQHPVTVVNKSTVPVGTAFRVKKIIKDELARRDLDFSFEVVSNPEFLKEGSAVTDFMKPDRVIIGIESEQTERLLRVLYAPFARSREKIIVMSIQSAELTKYAANCMLATKISFINEIALLCEKFGADVRDVRVGIGSDHRIGYHFIYPGLGYGGSCFPKDIKALIHTAESIGVEPKILKAVEAVNERQKGFMTLKIQAYFNKNGGVSGKRLAIWGLAFKANTGDIRESPVLKIIHDLTAQGMYIQAFDPVAGDAARDFLNKNDKVCIENDLYQVCQGADALFVVTEWNQFRTPDFVKIKTLLKKPILFDGRNLYSYSLMKQYGFTYFCVGSKTL